MLHLQFHKHWINSHVRILFNLLARKDLIFTSDFATGWNAESNYHGFLMFTKARFFFFMCWGLHACVETWIHSESTPNFNKHAFPMDFFAQGSFSHGFHSQFQWVNLRLSASSHINHSSRCIVKANRRDF